MHNRPRRRIARRKRFLRRFIDLVCRDDAFLCFLFRRIPSFVLADFVHDHLPPFSHPKSRTPTAPFPARRRSASS